MEKIVPLNARELKKAKANGEITPVPEATKVEEDKEESEEVEGQSGLEPEGDEEGQPVPKANGIAAHPSKTLRTADGKGTPSFEDSGQSEELGRRRLATWNLLPKGLRSK